MVPAIKATTDKTEQAAMAQKIFTDAFSVAQAQAKSGLGPLEQMKNTIAELTESFGKIIVTGITPIVAGLKTFAEWLNSLSDTTKKWIIGILATVAAVGPLLLILGKIPMVLSAVINGVTLLAGAFKSIGIFLISNPWIALAAAIAAAAVAISYFIEKSSDSAQANSAEGKALEAQMQRRDREKDQIKEYVAANDDGKKKIIDGLRDQANEYVKLYDERKKANDTAGMQYYKEQVENINALVATMKDEVTDLNKNKIKVIDPADGQTTALENLKKEVSDLNKEYENELLTHSTNLPITAKRLEQLQTELDRVQKLAQNEKDYIKSLEDENTAKSMHGATEKDLNGNVVPKGGEKAKTQTSVDLSPSDNVNSMVKPANDLFAVLSKVTGGLDGMKGSLGPLADSFRTAFSNIATLISDAAEGFGKKWGDAVQEVGAVVQSVVGVIGSIINTSFSNQEKTMDDYYSSEKDHINNSTMSEKQKSAALAEISKKEEKERKKLMREQAKDQKDIALVQAVIATALGIVTALANPGGVAGIVLAALVGVMGAIEIAEIASQPLPSLAEGGLAYAPQLALVGDNPNAHSDPEVIAPFSKIQKLFQGGGVHQVQVHGVLKGADIHLAGEQGQVQVSRIRGY
jgi:hypothetical protein